MRKRSGFTIVELLIVIVVIAILAAISIATYTGIQNRAYDSTVRSDLATIKKKLELYKVDDVGGICPDSITKANTVDIRFTKSAYNTTLSNVYYICNRPTGNYAIGVQSKSGKRFLLTNSSLQEDVNSGSAAAATAIGADWTDTANNYRIVGYDGNNSVWNSTLDWVAN